MNRFEVRIPFVMWATLEVVAGSEEAAVKKAKDEILWDYTTHLPGLLAVGGPFEVRGVHVEICPNDDPFDDRLHIDAEADDWGEA